MNIETQPLENHQVQITVEVDAGTFDEAKRRAARKVSKRTKIPGFRPGKAPYPVIVRQVGEAAIVEEALEILVNDLYPKMIEESGIKPYGPGSLENVKSVDPPVLEFVVPLQAEVELGDYRSIQEPYELKEVTDEDVVRVLDDLRERQAVLEPVERPAQEGDMVYVRLSAERKDPPEGEDETLVRERSVPVVIKPEGEDRTEWPFPGFSRRLIGLSPNDESQFTYTFPEESDFESLHGAVADFKFVVEDVKSRTLPELNAEFAASLGEYADVEALRKEVRESLERQAKETYDEEYDEKILNQAVEQATIKFPNQMLEREIDIVIDSFNHRLEHQKMDLDLYLKSRGIDMDAFREEARPVAETRMKKQLFLMELANVEKIQVEPEELQNETLRTVNSLTQSMSTKESRRLTDRNVFSNIVGSVMADLLTKRAVERMRDISSGKIEAQAQIETPADEQAEEAQTENQETPEQNIQMEASTEDAAELPPQEPASAAGDTISEEQESSPEVN